mmetsp:Transcript_3450/g.5301  ORF Transcript_3450/g.5301 Transcript_3450/m.5301 type:complete len:993 (+) Transcript_3450:371-3349(+)
MMQYPRGMFSKKLNRSIIDDEEESTDNSFGQGSMNDVASYGMGSTYGDSTIAADDMRSVEVSDYYEDPLSTTRGGGGGPLRPIYPPPPQYNTNYHLETRNAAAAYYGSQPSHSQQPPPPPPQQQQHYNNSMNSSRNSRRPLGNAPPPVDAAPKVSFRSDTKQRTKSSRKKRYNPSLPDSLKDDREAGRGWQNFSKCLTCCIPSCCIPSQKDKQAWREKVAICVIFLFFNVVFLAIFGSIPLYFCRIDDNVLSEYDWFNQNIDGVCFGLEIATYVIIFTVAALILLQCFCSVYLALQSFLFRIAEERPFHAKDFRDNVMVMVPCYNEGTRELGKTIKSIVDSDYPEEHKVLVVVADGIITGRGEYFNTPTVLANLLGFQLDKRDPAYSYNSLGDSGENRASLYSGIYETEDKSKSLKYIVVVKRGLPNEKTSSRPGNRGKRDSQLLMMGLMNRVAHDRKRTDLDKALLSALKGLEIPLQSIRYMLAIDADTRISTTSICHMVYRMNTRQQVLACCGETKVDNKTTSWVTMIQVYEYFASHHLKKSFESVFGCVTCLPGCFTMYRMKTDDGRSLLAADSIYQSYRRNDITSLHEKNLYHLGEDRMLTSLLLKYFPDMSLHFVPIAACWTIVPEGFHVLLSQRRRWINSTFHNMWELLKVQTMCGFCCISMNAVVMLDILATMVLPSGVIYAIGYAYVAIQDQQGMSLISVLMFGVLIGVQTLIFLMRSRLDYLLWFVIYLLLGIPVFYVILPIYSFWNMDDFSWGTTRQVTPDKQQKQQQQSILKKNKNNDKQQQEEKKKKSKQKQRVLPAYDDRLTSLGAGQTRSMELQLENNNNNHNNHVNVDVEAGGAGDTGSSSNEDSPIRRSTTTSMMQDPRGLSRLQTNHTNNATTTTTTTTTSNTIINRPISPPPQVYDSTEIPMSPTRTAMKATPKFSNPSTTTNNHNNNNYFAEAAADDDEEEVDHHHHFHHVFQRSHSSSSDDDEGDNIFRAEI